MKKLGWFLLVPMVILGALALLSAPAAATVVTLDGVANATWSYNPTTYLYVASPDYNNYGLGYYYKWNYGDTPSIPWGNKDAMVADLQAHTVTNWTIQSGGDPFQHPDIQNPWVTLHLAAGEYTLRLWSESEAYNLREYTWGGTVDPYLGSKVWNAYVQIYATGLVSTPFGGGEDTYRQTSMQDALDYYRVHVDGLKITLASAADVHFYINDSNSIDNGKSVTLEIVPLPGSLALLGPGLALLLAGGLWRRRLS